MAIELPVLKDLSAAALATPQERAAALLTKHQSTIGQLKEKLGFQKDETVVAWLLEQIEQSPDQSLALSSLSISLTQPLLFNLLTATGI